MNKKRTKSEYKRVRKGYPKGKTLTVVALAVIFILVLHCLFYIYSDEPKTSVARSGSIENVVSTSGYVIRDELVLNSPADGTLSCFYGEGERVSMGAVVAGVYSGAEDEETQVKLNAVNERLLAYGDEVYRDKFMTEDTFSVEYQTRSSIDSIVSAVQTRDMTDVLLEKQQLVRVLDRYKDADEETTYEALLKDKEALEAKINTSANQIVSPVSGVFSTQIDGYEGFFDTTDISKITADVLDKANEKQPGKNDGTAKKDKPAVKIFDNFEWYYAAEVDENQVADLRINSSVNIRFTNISNDLLPATVCAINKSGDGRVVLVVSCNRYEELIYRIRKAETEIVFGTYTGLKIPKSAVHIKEGKTGVYVLRDGVMHFKEAEVLYSGDTSVIIQQSTNSSGVMLYDEVITSGRNLQDGRRL